MKNKFEQNLPESYTRFALKFKANIDRLNKSKETMRILIKNPNIFLTTEGKDVPFIGYYYYNKHIPKLSDYEDLPPNNSTKRIVNITKDYLFEKGKTYRVFVPGGYYDPITDLYYCGKDGIAYFKY